MLLNWDARYLGLLYHYDIRRTRLGRWTLITAYLDIFYGIVAVWLCIHAIPDNPCDVPSGSSVTLTVCV